jgi:hypothetical protein
MSWRRFIPYLRVYIDLGFFRMQTVFVAKAYERMVFEWIVLRIELHKWQWHIELYSPEKMLRAGKEG